MWVITKTGRSASFAERLFILQKPPEQAGVGAKKCLIFAFSFIIFAFSCVISPYPSKKRLTKEKFRKL